jgi:hypothetical protein
MEHGEIDEFEITRSNESESSRLHGRKGRYKARRQHERQQTEIPLPFEPPKRFWKLIYNELNLFQNDYQQVDNMRSSIRHTLAVTLPGGARVG